MDKTPVAALDAETEAWIDGLPSPRTPEERALIRRACVLAAAAHQGQTRRSGEPYFRHVLGVARILADLRLDAETLAAALLHDVVEDTKITAADLEREFGPRIARLVDGVTKMRVIQEFRGSTSGGAREQLQAETLRKMVLAMAEDVRVVLIKLADRLHNMRTIDALPEDRRHRIARETLDIYAPLANRLGMGSVRWELEDLAFRTLETEAWRRLARGLDESRKMREAYLGRFIATLKDRLAQAGIEGDIKGRTKHLYGIWRKMQAKHRDLAHIFDVRAVRIVVAEVRDCYAALGVVHTAFTHIPGEFDDYIATPKPNGYRSIHTAVIGPEGKTVEVQIRTREMHEQSELGVAAHWRYKEARGADANFDRKISWLRSVLEWQDEVAHAPDFVDRFRSEIFADRVYVFTPRGSIVDLPAGATPLDFAYHIHTDVGHRCRGAKVNGHMVPLTYTLKTGEQVEILTAKSGSPSRDWASVHLGYLKTARARDKVTHWFKQQNLESSIQAGRDALERELSRLGVPEVGFERLAGHFSFSKVDDFLAAYGRGEIRPVQIAGVIQEAERRERPKLPPAGSAPLPARVRTGEGIQVEGVGSLLTHLARCCAPVYGDPIVGFITRARGVTVHRSDCPTALRHRGEHGDRAVEVSWGSEAPATFPVDIEVLAVDRPGLLRDISAVLANEKINVIAVQTLTDKAAHVARMGFTLEVPSLDVLSKVLARVDQIPNVTGVRRK